MKWNESDLLKSVQGNKEKILKLILFTFFENSAMKYGCFVYRIWSKGL